MKYLKDKFNLSIIVPFYNSKNILIKNLKNLSLANNKDIELILIDDGSKDDSHKVAKNFCKKIKNYKLIKLSKNFGPGYARNQGIKVSEGKYILFVDADDRINITNFKYLKNLIIKKNYDLIAFDFDNRCRKLNKKNRHDFNKITKKKDELIKNFLRGEIDGSVIFTCFKRKIITNNNIKFPNIFHEDIIFIFKCLYFSKSIKKLYKRIYIKIDTKNSITDISSEKRLIDLIKGFSLTKKFALQKMNIKITYMHFIRGLNGIMAYIIKNVLNNKSSYKKKLQIFEILFKIYNNELRIFKNLKLNLMGKKTIKDRITEHFIKKFKANRGKSIIKELNSYTNTIG